MPDSTDSQGPTGGLDEAKKKGGHTFNHFVMNFKMLFSSKY